MIKDGRLTGAMKNQNLYLLQFEPANIFFSSKQDILIWDILYDQADALKEKKYLASGFINMGVKVFYVDLIHKENNEIKRSWYCLCIQGNSIVEVIYTERNSPLI